MDRSEILNKIKSYSRVEAVLWVVETFHQLGYHVQIILVHCLIILLYHCVFRLVQERFLHLQTITELDSIYQNYTKNKLFPPNFNYIPAPTLLIGATKFTPSWKSKRIRSNFRNLATGLFQHRPGEFINVLPRTH